jgi:UDP-2,4-diacetamido-2,4,6-trideoxy-beta-L-altropyranose hydrolase
MNNKARWAFRVASRPEDGGGHVKRCLSLAKAMQSEADIVFILDDSGGKWRPLIEARGFSGPQLSDLPASHWQGCLIDGYGFTPEEIDSWRARSDKMVTIDDFGHDIEFADVILRPTATAAAAARSGQVIFEGPEYALIDPDYAGIAKKNPAAEVRKILVSMGSRDSHNINALVIPALEQAAISTNPTEINNDIEVLIAIGPDAPFLDQLRRQAKDSDLTINIATDRDNLVAEIADADLMIGAGGVSLLERMAAGLSSVTVAVAENQHPSVRRAVDAGATLQSAADISDLTSNISRMLSDTDLRKEISSQAALTVDGRGCARVAGILLHPDQNVEISEAN